MIVRVVPPHHTARTYLRPGGGTYASYAHPLPLSHIPIYKDTHNFPPPHSLLHSLTFLAWAIPHSVFFPTHTLPSFCLPPRLRRLFPWWYPFSFSAVNCGLLHPFRGILTWRTYCLVLGSSTLFDTLRFIKTPRQLTCTTSFVPHSPFL